MMERLDSRTKYPSAMEEYLETYGFHFNKKLFEYAVSMMRPRSGGQFKPWDKEKTEEFLKNYGVSVKGKGHDLAYIANMARADYYGSSITDENHLALFVSDYVTDPDGADTKAFDHFFIDSVAKGTPIFWDEML